MEPRTADSDGPVGLNCWPKGLVFLPEVEKKARAGVRVPRTRTFCVY